jgi:hypothetical protein
MLSAEEFLGECKTSQMLPELMELYAKYYHKHFSTELQSLEGVTRLEVIDKDGRAYINWHKDNEFSFSFQDQRRTLKIFNSRQ